MRITPSRTKRSLKWALGASLVLCLLFAVWLVPGILVDQDASGQLSGDALLKAKTETRTALIQAIGGLALLLGLVFTARTFALSKEGQLAERFGSAIERLGHQKPETRLGAVYALESLARSSRSDHRAVIELFSAMLRNREPGAPEIELQAAASMLGRRRRSFDLPGFQLDLREADLRSFDLSGELSFAGALLSGANFEGADLAGVDFTSATLTGGCFSGRQTCLIGVNFKDANIAKAKFVNSDLTSAHFLDRAHGLSMADFTDASLPDGFKS